MRHFYEKRCKDEGDKNDFRNGYGKAGLLIPFKDFSEIRGKQTVPVRKIEEDSQRMEIGIDVNLSPPHGLLEPFKPSLVKPVLDIVSCNETGFDFSLFEPFGNFDGGYVFKKIGIGSQI